MRTQTITDEQVTSVRDAPMVALPAAAPGQRGNVLPVRSIGIWPEPVTPYIRTTTGETYRLPADLYNFADSLMSMCLHGGTREEGPLLPALIDFRIQDGHVTAEITQSLSLKEPR